MSAIKCDVYRINFPQQYLQKVLVQLKINAVFEPIEPTFAHQDKELAEKKTNLESEYKKIKEAINFLEKFNDNKSAKKNSKIKATSADINSTDVSNALKDIKKINTEFKNLEELKSYKNTELKKIEEVSDLDIKIASSGELFNSKLLKMNVNVYDELKYDLAENDLINLESIKNIGKVSYAILLYDKSTSNLVDEIIEAKQIETLEVSDKEPISLKEYYQNLQKEYSVLEKSESEIIEKAQKISSKRLDNLKLNAEIAKLNIESLSLVSYVGYSFNKEYKHIDDSHDKKAVQDLIAKIELFDNHIKKSEMLHIDGWVIPEEVENLTKSLKKISSDINILKLDRDKLSNSRSSLKNSRVFEPFETITGLMGTPGSGEIDPSPYVAPFFVTFFGFALGDAGYGLIISLASLYALARLKLGKEVKKGITLMFYCGISTIVFGALTGGWFGADLEAIGPIGEFLSQFKVFDIASNIILVLVGSLIIGFLHQIFGLILSIYSHIKNSEFSKAIWGPSTWILLLLSFIAYAARDLIGVASLPWNWILIAVVALFSWGQGYGTKNPLIRPLKGFAAIFGLTSYLSNTLSYARLLALALATGVIASVVNLLATLFSGDIPIVSQLIAVLILVIGHAFNLILNLVGTFINVVRLHLVEFFPHFFDAQGVQIQPLKFESEYIIIESDANALDFSLA